MRLCRGFGAGHTKSCCSRPVRPASGSPAAATCCCAGHAPVDRSPSPLGGPELIAMLRQRWQASYDLQVVQRRGRLYLQVMWGHLEQQSFPMDGEAYAERIEQVAAALNDLGVADQVRQWLEAVRDRPRLGKALSLPLQPDPRRVSEFLL